MKRTFGFIVCGWAIALLSSTSQAQVSVEVAPSVVGGSGVSGVYSGTNSVYGAPGNFGMAYGTPSYGVPRLYSEFSSPYGGGYGYGYPPYGFLPGKFGVGLWRPGFVSPGYVYGSSYYQTFPMPYRPMPYGTGAPVGAYAPALGPPSFYSY